MKKVLAQTRVEFVLTLRRGESLLVNIGVPVGILAFFSFVDILPHGRGKAVDFLVPGVLALSVVSSAMTSLSIATGFERHAGVLRRLGTTPLGRSGLLAAKSVSLLFVLAAQAGVVLAVGLALGWRPRDGAVEVPIVMVLGAIAFAGIGFSLAGLLRAETNLAVANALFLVFLLLGGIVVSAERLPRVIASISRVLPAEPLASSLRTAFGGLGVSGRPLLTLILWAVGAGALAVTTFRWD